MARPLSRGNPGLDRVGKDRIELAPALDFSLVPRRLAETLSGAIVFGDLEPGSRIVEEEIAERFNVSRSPVREALRRLEVDGLLVREERRGVKVSPMSRRDLDEVYVCRLPLESVAATEAARHWTVAEMSRLIDALAGLESAFHSRDIRLYFTANVAFTDAVHHAAKNTTLRRLLAGIGRQALRYRFLAYRNFPQLIEASIEGSREILNFLKARDGAGASRLTERLIERSWMAIREHIAE